MGTAKLTHGGFYGHFGSRAALIAAALDRAIDKGDAAFNAAKTASPPTTVKSIVNRYLSPAHRDNAAEGCAFAALAGDVGRATDPVVRSQMAQSLERNIEVLSQAMGEGPEAREAAVVAWCAMVGAITLSRVFSGAELSDEILRLTRQAILDSEAGLQPNG